MGRRVWDSHRRRYLRKYSLYRDRDYQIPKTAEELERLARMSIRPSGACVEVTEENGDCVLVLPHAQGTSGRSIVKYIPDPTPTGGEDLDTMRMKTTYNYLRNFDFLLSQTILFTVGPTCARWRPTIQLATKCGLVSFPRDNLEKEDPTGPMPQESKAVPAADVPGILYPKGSPPHSSPNMSKESSRQTWMHWLRTAGRMLLTCSFCQTTE